MSLFMVLRLLDLPSVVVIRTMRRAPDDYDGGYANLLFDKFGHKRVYGELEAFLDRDFFPRLVAELVLLE